MGLSGRSRVGDVLRLAMSGKFNESRAKLLELTQVYGMSEGDFMKYANQEAYEMEIEKPEEFAAIMAEYRLQAYSWRASRNSAFGTIGAARQAG